MVNRISDYFDDEAPEDPLRVGDPETDKKISKLHEHILRLADIVGKMRARDQYRVQPSDVTPYEMLEYQKDRRRDYLYRRIAEYGLRRAQMKLRALLLGLEIFK